jgi:hypothetical protein
MDDFFELVGVVVLGGWGLGAGNAEMVGLEG